MPSNTQTERYNVSSVIFTACKQSLGQGNVFTPICDSVHGGVSAPLHAGIHTPLGRHPLGRHPQGDTPYPLRILKDMVNKQMVHILLEYILVYNQ